MTVCESNLHEVQAQSSPAWFKVRFCRITQDILCCHSFFIVRVIPAMLVNLSPRMLLKSRCLFCHTPLRHHQPITGQQPWRFVWHRPGQEAGVREQTHANSQYNIERSSVWPMSERAGTKGRISDNVDKHVANA